MFKLVKLFKQCFLLTLFLALIGTNQNFAQSFNKINSIDDYHPIDLPSDEPDMGAIAVGLGIVGAGALVPILWPSPSTELELNTAEIKNQITSLSSFNKPIKLSMDEGNKFGLIESISTEQIKLNELEANKIDDINLLMDLESAAKIDRASKTKWGLFLAAAGIGICVIASSSNSSGVDEVEDAENISQYLLYGAGACVIITGAIMYLTKSDAEDEWEKYENNYANDVSLSVDFGFQKISGNYLNTKNILQTVQPCITAKLHF